MNTRRIFAAGLVAGLLALAQVGTTAAQGQYGYQSRQTRYERLTGTYQLDRTRSDDPNRVADAAMRQVAAADRDRISRRLTNRLDPPDMLTLERQGTSVRMASSRAPELSFVADGRNRNENSLGRQTVTTRAAFVGERLDVSSRGAAGSDFTVSFEPVDQNTLRVTRRLYDERLRQPVTVRSVYRRVSTTPDWDVYNGYNAAVTNGQYDDRYNDQRYNDQRSNDQRSNDQRYNDQPGNYGYDRNASIDRLLSDGTTLTATLDQPINTRTSRQDDRITLTVQNAPRAELEGAVIEGLVTSAPRSVNGRTGMSIAFDRIRLRDGRTADFNGTIDAVRKANGDPIAYDGEQVDTGRSTSEQAIQRGAIGAAIGAVIGALAGGGQGAAIGAVVGGGGAAATVFVDPLNPSTLDRGTEFTIRTQRR